MKQQLPPNNREELEAQVTALLLGELTEEQAAAVRVRIAQDKELAEWHDTLTQTLPLVRETVATPAGETAAQPAPLKLNSERREKLLAQFKTVSPKELSRPTRRKTAWLVPMAYAAALALVAVVSVRTFINTRKASFRSNVISNLILLDSSKQQWALEQRKSSTAVPTMEDLKPYFGRGSRSEVPGASGETYILGPVGQHPVAEVDLGEGKKTVITLPGTDFADRDSRGLLAGSDNMTRDASEVAKDVAPASPAPIAQTPIALPPGNADNYAPANPDRTGGMTDGTGIVSARRSFRAGRALASGGGGGVGGIQPADTPPSVSTGALNPAQESGQTAKRGPVVPATALSTQSTHPVGEESESVSTGTIPIVGTVSGAVTLARTGGAIDFQTATAAQAHSPRNLAIGVQGGTAPQEQTVGGGFAGVQTGTAIQAQSFAASTIGVPSGGNSSTWRGIGAPAPADAPTPGQPVDIAGNVSQPIAQSASQNQSDYKKLAKADRKPESLERLSELDAALPRGVAVAPVPQPEVQTLSNAFSTFSLNVSDVAFKLAAASLENGVMPDVVSIRSEEFINAFDYRDPEPAPGAPIGFAWERAADPFAHNRDFLRLSVKTAAQGRDAGRPLNLVLLLDKSGSMERADRVEIIRQALTVLAGQLRARDTLSVVTFARTPRLWVDGVPGTQAGEVAKKLSNITPEGGTNLEEAMRLAYATALRHYLASGENRVVLLTDGAANLGEVNPDVFKPWVESNRKQGIALDCFGIGWDGYNDTTLESLSRSGGGRYGFINTPEEAATGFAGQLAGALRVAASEVKAQVEFNPNRVVSYRQIGYANDQLTKEQFRDNTVAAAQIGAAESGNALYTVEVNAAGDGPLCTVRVRYRDPGTSDYHEHAWDVPYSGVATPLDKAAPAMRLAVSAAAFSELLAGSPFAGEVTFDKLLNDLNGVPAVYGADTRPQKLEWMVRQAKSISGK